MTRPANAAVPNAILKRLAAETARLHDEGLFKDERVITTPQDAVVRVDDGPRAHQPLRQQLPGTGQSPGRPRRRPRRRGSLRLRHGLRPLHLRHAGPSTGNSKPRLTRFLGTEDTILYSSCFDANGGLFETLLDERGCRHQRRAQSRQHHRRHPAVQGQALPLRQRRHGRPGSAASSRPPTRALRLIATDGVFSMDGTIARLREICDLADRYDALVMVDDSHAVGIHGRRRPRHARALRRPRTASTSSRARSARRSAAAAAATRRAAGRSSPGCVSARGRTCSRTAFPRPSRPPRSACSISWKATRRCAIASSRTRGSSASA